MAGQYHVLDSRDIIADFFNRLKANAPADWTMDIAQDIPSDSASETYTWLGQSPGMRQWVGSRAEQTLKRFTQTGVNVSYEDTLMIRLADLRRDKTAQLRQRAAEMADAARDHPVELTTDILNVTTTGDSYDDNAYFATDHDESGDDQVNELTVTQVPSANVSDTAAPTATEMSNIIVESVGHYYTIVNDQGRPMNTRDRRFKIVCPNAQYWAAAQKAISLNNLSSGASNPLASIPGLTFDVVLEPRLTTVSTNLQLMIFNADSPAKPLINQVELPLETSLLGDGSDYAFDNKAHKFGLESSRVMLFGFWQKAMRITLN